VRENTETGGLPGNVDRWIVVIILAIFVIAIGLVDRFRHNILDTVWEFGWGGLVAGGLVLLVLGLVGIVLHFFPGEKTKIILRSLGEGGKD
jgi:uncharacterized membrane protein YbaN (DUF454 family)